MYPLQQSHLKIQKYTNNPYFTRPLQQSRSKDKKRYYIYTYHSNATLTTSLKSL
jgi:hypothetical protein